MNNLKYYFRTQIDVQPMDFANLSFDSILRQTSIKILKKEIDKPKEEIIQDISSSDLTETEYDDGFVDSGYNLF